MNANHDNEQRHEGEHYYTYVLIRTDLAIEQQLVQVAHASLEAGFAYEAPPTTCSIVLLSVPDREALEAASERLHRHGIAHQMFYEPDFNMGNSAIATRPISKKSERYLMRKYPSYGRGKIAATSANRDIAQEREVIHA